MTCLCAALVLMHLCLVGIFFLTFIPNRTGPALHYLRRPQSGMRQLHIHTKQTILRTVDFFYPPFRRFLPKQTFRYAACGGANMLFDIVLYAFFYNIVFQKQNVQVLSFTISPYIAAFLTAFCISFPTGFYLSRYVVFQQSSIRGRIQLLRYFMVVMACFLLNYLFLKLFVEYFDWYPTPSKIITTVIVVVFSFISQSYFSFGNKRKVSTHQGIEMR